MDVFIRKLFLISGGAYVKQVKTGSLHWTKPQGSAQKGEFDTAGRFRTAGALGRPHDGGHSGQNGAGEIQRAYQRFDRSKTDLWNSFL